MSNKNGSLEYCSAWSSSHFVRSGFIVFQWYFQEIPNTVVDSCRLSPCLISPKTSLDGALCAYKNNLKDLH